MVREKSRECHNRKPQPIPKKEETDKTKQAPKVWKVAFGYK